jgi:hypothetical protein
MAAPTRNPAVEQLAPLEGRWRIEARFPGAPPAGGGEVTFAWIEERAFLVQRWRVDEPAAPDGIAVLGFDEGAGGLVQRYFDSRGVARVYRTTVEDGVWRLWRDEPGFDQRYEATIADDGATIAGAWEKRTDGETWEHDFELIYTRAADRLALARASYAAFGAGDREAIERLLAPDLRFSSPPDPDLDRAGYFERCWPHSGNRNAFSFERLQEIGDDQVLVTYEAQRPDDTRFRNTEVLTFDGDRIRRIEVYFGWNLE